MWFAKWFGGRSDKDDEPARFAPPAPKSRAPAKRAQGNIGEVKGPAGTKQDKSGFDPYNSGSYDRNQAWERVLR
jgi:hypothetical protein